MKHRPTLLPPTPSCDWIAELVRRIRCHIVFKTCGISAFIWVFFIGYFQVLRHPVHPVTIMPLTALDRMIPFQPQALVPYLSLWFYLGIAPGLLLTYRELIAYGLWIAALCGVGMACFYTWPSAVPPLGFDVTGHPGFAMLQGVDATGNACPSLHVATALFTAIWVEHMLRQLQMPWGLRLANAASFAAIAYSTLATKQHVLLDALAGAALGTIFALAALRWRPQFVT
ncbi:MAG: phosphatase PAP2 family protein [Verrucomicrobiota bacterium]